MKRIHVATYIALSFLTTNILKAAASDPALTDPTPATASAAASAHGTEAAATAAAVGSRAGALEEAEASGGGAPREVSYKWYNGRLVPVTPAAPTKLGTGRTIAGGAGASAGAGAGARHSAAAESGTSVPATAAAAGGTVTGAGVDVSVLSRVIETVRFSMYSDYGLEDLNDAIAATGFTLEGRAAPAPAKAVATSSTPDLPLIRAALTICADAGSPTARAWLDHAAYHGELGFTPEEGFKYLEDRAAKDEYAQKLLNQAAYHGDLGFTPEEGFKYLEDRAAKDEYAQKRLNQAAYNSELGFTPATGRKYLEDRAAKDEDAQKLLNQAANDGMIGFSKLGFTPATGRKYLDVRAAAEDEDAQKRLNQKAYYGICGFTLATGRKYLEDRAAKDEDAQKLLNEAACHGKLGFKPEEGRKYLEDRAAKDEDAQKRLNEAACHGDLGFTPEEGFKYLEARAAKDEDAQERLNEAAYNILSSSHSSSSRIFTYTAAIEYLKARTAAGDKYAKERFKRWIDRKPFVTPAKMREYLQIIADAEAGTLAPATAAGTSVAPVRVPTVETAVGGPRIVSTEAGAGARYSSAAGGAGASAAAGMTDLPTTVLLTPENLNDVGKMNKAIALTIDPKEGFKLLGGLIATYPAAIQHIYSIKLSSIGDGDLKHLEGLTHLRELHLSFGGLTDLTVLSGLKSKLPDLKIVLT